MPRRPGPPPRAYLPSVAKGFAGLVVGRHGYRKVMPGSRSSARTAAVGRCLARPTGRSSTKDIVPRRTVQGFAAGCSRCCWHTPKLCLTLGAVSADLAGWEPAAPLCPSRTRRLSPRRRQQRPRSRGCRHAAHQPCFGRGCLTGIVRHVDLELCTVVGRHSQAIGERRAVPTRVVFLVLAELIIYRGYLDLSTLAAGSG